MAATVGILAAMLAINIDVRKRIQRADKMVNRHFRLRFRAGEYSLTCALSSAHNDSTDTRTGGLRRNLDQWVEIP